MLRFQKDPSSYAAFLADWETCGAVNFLGLERTAIRKADVNRINRLRAIYPDGQLGLTLMFGDAIFAVGYHQLNKSIDTGSATNTRQGLWRLPW